MKKWWFPIFFVIALATMARADREFATEWTVGIPAAVPEATRYRWEITGLGATGEWQAQDVSTELAIKVRAPWAKWVRFRVQAISIDGRLSPWSDQSEAVRWMPDPDADGKSLVTMRDITVAASLFARYNCDGEWLDGIRDSATGLVTPPCE